LELDDTVVDYIDPEHELTSNERMWAGGPSDPEKWGERARKFHKKLRKPSLKVDDK
jgi:hypothetical protein